MIFLIKAQYINNNDLKKLLPNPQILKTYAQKI